MKLLLFIMVLVGAYACKKELTCEDAIQLTDEKTSFLVGEWAWEYTIKRVLDKGTGNTVEDTIYASEKDEKYTISLQQKGKVEFKINDELLDAYCIIDSVNVSTYYPNIAHISLSIINIEEETSYLTYIHTFNSSKPTFFNINDLDFPYNYEETDQEQIFYNNYGNYILFGTK